MAPESFSRQSAAQYSSAVWLGGLVALGLVAGTGLKIISKIERSHDPEFADAANTAGNVSLITTLGAATFALARGLLRIGNNLTSD